MLDPRTKFPHTVGATWGNALATFQNAGFWCATTLLAHHIPGFSRDGLEKSRSLAAGGGIWCLRAWCECQRTQFLLGEGVKAQVVKSGLRLLSLGSARVTPNSFAQRSRPGEIARHLSGKIGNLVHVLPRLAPNTHINNQRPGLLRARPAQRSNLEKKSYRFRPGSTYPQSDCP